MPAKFEYKVVAQSHPYGADVDLTETQTFLSAQGTEGWELVSACITPSPTQNIINEIFYFKRMVTGPSALPTRFRPRPATKY